MKKLTAFRLTQSVYWLSLGTWFGAIVMLIVCAVATFGTVREYQPTLGVQPYNNPAMSDRAPAILAGAIVGNALNGLTKVQLICGVAAVICVVLQCTLFADRLAGGITGWVNLLRIVLIISPLVLLAVDTLGIRPALLHQRQTMYDPQQPEHTLQEAKAKFDQLHRRDEQLVAATALVLLAAVTVSSFVLHSDTKQPT